MYKKRTFKKSYQPTGQDYKKRKNRNKRKSGNYLYGKNSVLERLRTNPESIKTIYFQDKFSEDHIVRFAEEKNVQTKWVSEGELMRLKRADRLQGIVADVDMYKYTEIEDLLEAEEGDKKTLICLDGVSDPHNLGAIMRILACLGGFAIVIPKHNSCEVNDTAMHVASGAENYVPVSMVNNLSTGLMLAKENGYTVAGAIVEQGEDIDTFQFDKNICLVLGSEGKGIRKGLRQYLDHFVRIPMHGAKLSFNVSMACSIFAYEIKRSK